MDESSDTINRGALANKEINLSFLRRNSAVVISKWKKVSRNDLGRNIEDFIFLSLLGISVGTLSFVIDIALFVLHSARLSLIHDCSSSVAGQYFGWVFFYVIVACFAVGITHAIAPTAAGSGIPEIKTMIRGVVLKEYLTFRTLVAKVIGLIAALGSGLPVGKEGPFVHVAGATAAFISKFLPSFNNDENREPRMTEILMPAAAVGVSCTFAAPCGGLLYSLECTSTFFAIRNYWRGFYASAIGTLFFRSLAIWFKEERTLTALERTHFPQEVPYAPLEIVFFLILGALCGLFGVCFILVHKSIVLFIRRQKHVSQFLSKNRFIYPAIAAFIVGSLMFPFGLGQFSGGELINPEALKDLYSNFTWSTYHPENIDEQHTLHHWLSPLHNVFVTTFLFFVMRLLICAFSTTIALPCGMIVPAFTIGAGLGRFFGEGMAYFFPDGIANNAIIPGGYAVVGSVAMAGAITQTFSPVVIAFELTGQIGHVMPSLLAVMIANVVSRCFSPSVYEVIIQIKKLPYLPSHIDSHIKADVSMAENIMVRDVHFLTLSNTYGDALNLLQQFPFKLFPIVESKANMILLGAIGRVKLKKGIVEQLSTENKEKYFSTGKNAMSNSRDTTVKRKENNVNNYRDIEDMDKNAVVENIENFEDQEEEEWMRFELDKKIDFDLLRYNTSPYQVVKRTSLYKVHHYFSLLSLHHAVVTDTGRLVGIISLSEVRKAVQIEVNIVGPSQKCDVSLTSCINNAKYSGNSEERRRLRKEKKSDEDEIVELNKGRSH